jgi:hypothetical protein
MQVQDMNYQQLYKDRNLPKLLDHLRTQSAPDALTQLQNDMEAAMFLEWMWDLTGAEASLIALWPKLRAFAAGAPANHLVLRFVQQAEAIGRAELAAAGIAELRAPIHNKADCDVAARRVRTANDYADRLRGSPARIIPAGEGCLPYNLLMRWGMREFAVQGPFTYGVFHDDGVALALEDNFRLFRRSEHYVLTRSPQGSLLSLLPPYKAVLNHEAGTYFCDALKVPLVALYDRRIESLCAELRCGPSNILFMENKLPDSAARVLRAFDRHYPGCIKRVLILDQNDAFASDVSSRVMLQDPRVRLLALPEPTPDYVWHLHSNMNSEAGLAWEGEIAAMLAEEIARCR